MPSFSFTRKENYPNLDIQVHYRIGAIEKPDYVAFASLTARGPVAVREKWRRDVLQWASSRGVQSIYPRYGAARQDQTSAFDLTLRGWTIVADFLLVWVGEEAFREIGDPIATQIQRLADSVRRLENVALRQEQRVLAISTLIMESTSP